jgi:hypothetical protein
MKHKMYQICVLEMVTLIVYILTLTAYEFMTIPLLLQTHVMPMV